SVSLQCVFHSIRFKVNKGWSKALLLFLYPYLSYHTNHAKRKRGIFPRNEIYLYTYFPSNNYISLSFKTCGSSGIAPLCVQT
ncbi:hypothetical protein GA414_14255, partial [Bacteroides xylanisolvens]